MDKKKNRLLIVIAALATVLVMLVCVVVGISGFGASKATATVTLDVNPSIQITINNNEQVLDVVAMNDAAGTVLKDMDLKGADLEVAVNAIIGSMLRKGYISEIANSILVSVDSQDPAVGTALREKLAQEIIALLNTETFSGAVLSQTVTHETEVEKLAKENNITLGKAQLISRIIRQDETRSFTELAKLSINELNLISSSAKTPLENVTSSGTASDKSYIGKQEALNAAVNHAGVPAGQIAGLQIEMDHDGGGMLYEVEFSVAGYEYDYGIDAKTGSVLSFEKEADDDTDDPGDGQGPAANALIGEAAAMNAALQHAEVSEDAIRDYVCELEEDDGSYRYDIGFVADGYEYEYEIDACTGVVLKSEKELDDDGIFTPQTTVPSQEQVISQEEALGAALQHLGLTKDQITDQRIELDADDSDEGDDYGVAHYEIHFLAGGIEYEFDIHALTGEILYYEVEEVFVPVDTIPEDDDHHQGEEDDFFEDDPDDYYDDSDDSFEDDYEDDYGDEFDGDHFDE